MKSLHITYFLLISLIGGLFFTSCEKESTAYMKDIEGHWKYTETKTDISVTDPTLQKKIEDYILMKNAANRVSYEFKRDKSYYFYQNYSEPLKGSYKDVNDNYLEMQDAFGRKVATKIDSVIYIVSDFKDQAVHDLGINESLILKANSIDIFERGLSPK